MPFWISNCCEEKISWRSANNRKAMGNKRMILDIIRVKIGFPLGTDWIGKTMAKMNSLKSGDNQMIKLVGGKLTALPKPIPANELAISIFVLASSSSGSNMERRKYFSIILNASRTQTSLTLRKRENVLKLNI
jgi:hypothetical protein